MVERWFVIGGECLTASLDRYRGSQVLLRFYMNKAEGAVWFGPDWLEVKNEYDKPVALSGECVL